MSIRGTSRYHTLPVTLEPDQQQYSPQQPTYAGVGSPGIQYSGQFDGSSVPAAGPQGYSVNPSVAFPYGNSNYQSTGYAGGAGNSGIYNSNNVVANFLNSQDGFLNKAHEYSEKIDTFLGKVGAPLKPYLPLIGRFLIVATFFEDGFRIMTQWNSQVSYIYTFRGLPYFFTVIYLALNVVFMYTGSALVMWRKNLLHAVGVLLFVVVSQALVYGLLFNFSFFCRNLSVIGGLLVVMSDAFVNDRRSLAMAGLPMMEEKDRSKYFMLAGRVLMIFLFLAYIATEHITFTGLLGLLIGLTACGLVVVGYKARLSAAVLILILTYRNLTTNQYWAYGYENPVRDFLRYEHFQILSIIGGLLLVVNTGAGALSIDEKKKTY
ncbi:hypothetical protein D0Z03_000166 [Geotrichum reessii]|nr:hypothetical protein D0Z03_000166 [Galactomyces reessii]